MAGKLGGNDDDPIAEINVVPLVDVILVVLIIFMVTAPLVLKPSIDINLPKASTGDESPVTPLIITISRDGQLLLNGKASTLEDITLFATNLAKAKPDAAAVLAADKDSNFGRVAEIMDLIRAAGVKRLAVSTDKK